MNRRSKAQATEHMTPVRLFTDIEGNTRFTTDKLAPNGVFVERAKESIIRVADTDITITAPQQNAETRQLVYSETEGYVIDFRNVHECKIYTAECKKENGMRYVRLTGDAKETLSSGYALVSGSDWSLHEILLVAYAMFIRPDDPKLKEGLIWWMNDVTVSIVINHMNSNRSTHDVTLLEFCTQDDNIRHGDRAAELRISFSILNEYKLLPEDFKEHYKYLGFTAIDPNGLDWFSSVYLEAIHKKDSRYLMSQCIKRGLFEYSKEVLTENTLDVSETHIGMDKYYYADMMDISLSAQNRYRAYTRYIGKSNKMEAAFLSAKTQKQAKEILMQATTDDIRRVLHKLSKQMSDATADEVPLENMDCKELDKMAANIRLCTMELKDRQTSSLIVESKALKKSKEQEAKLSKEKAEQARAAAREADRAAREAAREAEKEVKATRSARTSQARTEKVMAQLRKNTEARIKAMREIREAIEIV